jgi:hypothetical protein
LIPSLLEQLVFCYGKNEECPLFKFKQKTLKKEMQSSNISCSQDFHSEQKVQ